MVSHSSQDSHIGRCVQITFPCKGSGEVSNLSRAMSNLYDICVCVCVCVWICVVTSCQSGPISYGNLAWGCDKGDGSHFGSRYTVLPLAVPARQTKTQQRWELLVVPKTQLFCSYFFNLFSTLGLLIWRVTVAGCQVHKLIQLKWRLLLSACRHRTVSVDTFVTFWDCCGDSMNCIKQLIQNSISSSRCSYLSHCHWHLWSWMKRVCESVCVRIC